MVMTSTHAKSDVKGQLVQKTDGQTDFITLLANVVGSLIT